MSTDRARASAGARGTRRGRARARQARRFVAAFAIVVAALVVAGATGAALTTTQGPRVTDVQVDPAAAAAASGSRLIVTTTQSLQEVEPSQVTVTPDTAFTVDTSGRSVGVRFTLPLYDETDYTVTIAGLEGVGGGPTSTVTETFTTPGLQTYLLVRAGAPDGTDAIFRTDLKGENAVPVFTHRHIEDFRATATYLAISVRTDDDLPALLVTDLAGQNERSLDLPDDGDGYVTNLQSADRGDVIGYTYSDRDLGSATARESALFTQSLKDPDAPPAQVPVAGEEKRVDDWRFVPDTDSLLLLTFDSRLQLSAVDGENPVELGSAIAIDGIARGSSLAAVERPDGSVMIDLSDGTDSPLALSPDLAQGSILHITPLPGAAAGTLQTLVRFDGLTNVGTTVEVVTDDGTARPVFQAPETDAVLQTCMSPSGRYAAVLVAPDVVSNPYDTYALPVPATVETHIIALDDADPVVALAGFDLSWCRIPPR